MIRKIEIYECSLCKELFREDLAAQHHAAICTFDDYAIKSKILGRDYAEWVADLEKTDAMTRAREEVELAYKLLVHKQARNKEAPSA